MKKDSFKFVEDLFLRRADTAYLKNAIESAVDAICGLGENKKILLCGNGGSAADCEHFAGELNKGFILKRRITNELEKKIDGLYPEDTALFVKHLQQGVPSVPLTSFISTNTAYLNDCEPDLLFAQGVNSLGNRGDVLVCFSTSGNSANVLYAAKLAKAKGLTVVSFTGESGGKLKYLSDVLLNVPSSVTHLIQEYHLSLYHTICLCVENELFA
ncbi:MAG: SIS domain-containing protein [Clostridia bacterium]|nr:SIS domain-containing protein [Clostridia bacterium]